MITSKRFTSSITFLYYEEYQYGISFVEQVLDLSLVMDQGFARVYQVHDSSFLGIVSKQDRTSSSGDTLFSLNTSDVQEEYQRVQSLNVENLTPIQRIESIPLDSFFFEDKEGHRFEIQQFLDKDIRNQF